MTRLLFTLVGVALLAGSLAGCDTAEVDEVYSGPTVTFTSAGTNAAEGDSVAVPVRLTGGTGQPVTAEVLYAAGASTATDGVDVSGFGPGGAGLQTKTITFSGAADETRLVRFKVKADSLIEQAEQVVLALQNVQGARIGRQRDFTLVIGTLPLSTIRSFPDGTKATIEGVVTRLGGRFIYLQDGTAGISVFSPSGKLFEAVAAGQVAEGDRIQIAGEVDIFNNLIQLSFVDDFAVIARAVGVPAPQTVTLAQLTSNLADYQSELVRVTGLTINTTDVVFAISGSGRNYTVTGPNGTTYAMRVLGTDGNANGTPIPKGPFTFTGIIGQFGASGQLTVVKRSDLTQ